MIATLLLTVLVEGIVASAYARWHKKPLGPILLTSIPANIITQAFLWAALIVFFRHYFLALWVAEILIWLIEAVCLYAIRFNRLSLRESLVLSFGMNLTSFALGWFLPQAGL